MSNTIKTDEYIEILKEMLKGWTESDPEKTAEYYDQDLEYIDPNVRGGISGRNKFIAYLRVLFNRWPVQEWACKEVFPHSNPGQFSIRYDFRFANPALGKEIKGEGMDYIEFKNDKIIKNYVYLNADLWRNWIKTV
ncbi:MAG: nuclear transport factor 2 family protein [Leptospiraceae bacterium]|nr:nuclear transport factor 2 family protein [Leptospiraceae bacterium]